MEVKQRKDRSGARLAVSVLDSDIKRVNDALAYLIRHHNTSGSKIIVDLIITAARRAGWTPADAAA